MASVEAILVERPKASAGPSGVVADGATVDTGRRGSLPNAAIYSTTWIAGAQIGRSAGKAAGFCDMDHVLSTHVLVPHRINTVWLDRIWAAGIPKVEILCARQHFDYRDRSQVNELGYWFRDARLQCHSLHSPMYNDDCWGRTGRSSVVTLTERSKPRRLESVDEIKRAIEVAEKVPFRYLIQRLGVAGEEYDEFRLEAAFSALEDLALFARHRGVEILLENIPNRLPPPSA